MEYRGQVENLLIVQGDYRHCKISGRQLSESYGEGCSRGRCLVIVSWIRGDVHDNNGGAGVVESEVARIAGTGPRGEALTAACEPCSSSTTLARFAGKKPCRVVNSPISFSSWRWSRGSIDHDPHIIAFNAHWIAADLPIGVGKTLSGGNVEGPEVPGAADELAFDGTLADWSSTMRAFVIDGIYRVLHLEERD